MSGPGIGLRSNRQLPLITGTLVGRWNSDGRLEFIGEMVEQYKVDGVVSEIVRFCTYNGWDKFDLKKQMEQSIVPILDIDLEYGHPAGAQVKIRAEAFMEMLENRAR